MHPNDAAILADVALLGAVGADLAPPDAGAGFQVARQIIGMGDGGEIARQELLGAVAQHLAKSLVDLHIIALLEHDGHADGRVLHGGAKGLLALGQCDRFGLQLPVLRGQFALPGRDRGPDRMVEPLRIERGFRQIVMRAAPDALHREPLAALAGQQNDGQKRIPFAQAL